MCSLTIIKQGKPFIVSCKIWQSTDIKIRQWKLDHAYVWDVLVIVAFLAPFFAGSERFKLLAPNFIIIEFVSARGIGKK